MGLPARRSSASITVHPGLSSKQGLWRQQVADSLQPLVPLQSDSSADPPTPKSFPSFGRLLWGQREMGYEEHSSKPILTGQALSGPSQLDFSLCSILPPLSSCLIPIKHLTPRTPLQHLLSESPTWGTHVDTHKVQTLSHSSLSHTPTFKDKWSKSETSSSKYLSLSHLFQLLEPTQTSF